MTRVIRPADRKAFAASRDFGIEMRTLIQESLKESDVVTVDLEGIEDMTPSFADECFGKMSEAQGFDVTERKVKILNGDRYRPLIEAVTRLRLQRRKAEPGKAGGVSR